MTLRHLFRSLDDARTHLFGAVVESFDFYLMNELHGI